jgi:hypothetical protein
MQFRFINIIKQLKNDKTTLIVSLCVLGLILVTLLTSCGNKEQSVQPPSSVTVATTVPVVTTVPVPETTSAPTTTMPDLSGVDWVALAREQHGKCGEWHDLAISVGWPEEEWKHLQQVIYRESRCQADAWNGADGGLTQINQIHTKWLSDMGWSHPNDMFDPEKNLTFAFRLWETSGWKPWRFSGSTFGD